MCSLATLGDGSAIEWCCVGHLVVDTFAAVGSNIDWVLMATALCNGSTIDWCGVIVVFSIASQGLWYSFLD